MSLYFYNYLLGFALLLMLSFMHVVLEFPLNHRSFRDIHRHLFALPGSKSRVGGQAGKPSFLRIHSINSMIDPKKTVLFENAAFIF